MRGLLDVLDRATNVLCAQAAPKTFSQEYGKMYEFEYIEFVITFEHRKGGADTYYTPKTLKCNGVLYTKERDNAEGDLMDMFKCNDASDASIQTMLADLDARIGIHVFEGNDFFIVSFVYNSARENTYTKFVTQAHSDRQLHFRRFNP